MRMRGSGLNYGSETRDGGMRGGSFREPEVMISERGGRRMRGAPGGGLFGSSSYDQGGNESQEPPSQDYNENNAEY